MTPLVVILTIAGYFALLLGISYFASRGSDNSTFFTGNRRTPWALVAFAMIGAAISGVTFVSVPGMVVNSGYSYLQMVLGFIVGYFLIAAVLVPIFYKKTWYPSTATLKNASETTHTAQEHGFSSYPRCSEHLSASL